ncbi:hypothetical protein ACTXKN_12560 [Brachybacterium alimentarium]|uniref:hypothetical protein n=1 Tax=Brachybacterium alimentarium TaxID=47845 RepID=UPI003FD00875
MVDIAKAIEPRSDQQNYDDYIAGPRTVTVEAVDQDKEGRASIHLIEYPGRPFKPSKTNLRLIAQAWGTEAVQWNGRRMTLAGDPTVRFGGQQVGGIRVIALSHIEKAFTANLTTTRGKRAPYKVDVLATEQPPPIPAFTTVDDYRTYFQERVKDGAGPDELDRIQQAAAAVTTTAQNEDN